MEITVLLIWYIGGFVAWIFGVYLPLYLLWYKGKERKFPKFPLF